MGSECESGQRQEWMFIAELNSKSTESVSMTADYQQEYWQRERSKYNLQQIGDMPHWINMQKSENNVLPHSNVTEVDIETLNTAQRTAYEIVRKHFSCKTHNPDKSQLLMVLTGMGGSGKSYVIDAINVKCKCQ